MLIKVTLVTFRSRHQTQPELAHFFGLHGDFESSWTSGVALPFPRPHASVHSKNSAQIRRHAYKFPCLSSQRRTQARTYIHKETRNRTAKTLAQTLLKQMPRSTRMQTQFMPSNACYWKTFYSLQAAVSQNLTGSNAFPRLGL